MRRTLFVCFISLWLVFQPNSILFAEDVTPSVKAARYLKALESRPESKTLYTRFFETWLETHSLDQLQSFLADPKRDSIEQALILCRFYTHQKVDDKAVGVLEKVAKHAQSTPLQKIQALEELSGIARRASAFDQSLGHLKAAREIAEATDDFDQVRLKDLGKKEAAILFRLSRNGEGLTILRKLLAEYPDDRDLHEDVVSFLAFEGQVDKSIEEQQKLISKLKAGEDVYSGVKAKIDLGKLYQASGDNRQAIDIWQNALFETGNQTWIEKEIVGLIEGIHRSADDLLGLRDAIQAMIEKEPKRLSLQVVQARLLVELRMDEAAIKQWKYILSLTPGDKEMRLNYVRTLAELDRPKEAAEQLRSLIDVNPGDAEMLFELAAFQDDAGNGEDAKASLLEFLNRSDKSEFSHLRVARALVEIDQTEAADSIYQKMIKQFSESASASDAYAAFLYSNDEKPAALKRWASLSAKGDLTQHLRAINQLVQRFESKDALKLMEARLDEFGKEPRFLEEISSLYLVEKRPKEGFSFALKRVEMATTAGDLDKSIDLAMRTGGRMNDEYSEALKIVGKSESLACKCLYATLLEASGNENKAVETLKELIGDGARIEAQFPLLTLAKIHAKQKDWSAAGNSLLTLVTKTPGGRKSIYIQDLILCLERSGNPDDALVWTREWQVLSPSSYQAVLREARLLEDSGRISRALSHLQESQRRFKDIKEISLELARMYIEAGFVEDAEQVYWSLYEKETDPWARQEWISKLTDIAKTSQRESVLVSRLKERRKNNPKSIGPLIALAEVYKSRRAMGEYRATLFSASALDPSNLGIIHRIADLDEEAGDYRQAIKLLQKVEPQDKSGRTTLKISKLHVADGDLVKALEMFSNLPDGRKLKEDEALSIAFGLAKLGEWGLATEFLSERLADYPNNIDTRWFYALGLIVSDQEDRALEALLAMLEFEFPPGGLNTAGQQLYAGQPNVDVNDPLAVDIDQWYIAFRTRTSQFRELLQPGQKVRGPTYFVPNTFSNFSYLVPRNKQVLRGKVCKLLSELKSVDFSNPEIRKRFIEAGGRQWELGFLNGKEPQEIYALNQENAELALWYVKTFARSSEDSEQAGIGDGIETVEKTMGAEKAAVLAFRVGQIDQGLSLVAKIDKVSDLTMSTMIQVIRNSELDKAQKDTVLRLVKNWNLESDNIRLLSPVLDYLANSGEADLWLEKIQWHWQHKNLKSKDGSALKSWLRNSRVRNSSFFYVYRPGMSIAISSIRISMIRGKVLSRIKEFEDRPLLYFVVAQAAGDDTAIQKSITLLEELCKAGNGDFQDFYFLANWHAQKKGGEVRACELFEKANKLASCSMEETLIAQRIFYLARGSEDGTPLRGYGEDAVLRLRLDANIEVYDWRSYSSYLTRWGMNDKVKRPNYVLALNRRRLGQLQQRRRLMLASSTSYFQLPDLNRFRTKLTKTQDKQSQVNILGRQLPLQAGRILTYRGSSEKRKFKSIVDLIAKVGLTDQVLKRCEELFEQGEKRHLDRVRLAAVYDLFDRFEEAEKRYRELLSEYPQHPVLSLRLLTSIAATDPKRAFVELRGLTHEADGDTLDSDLFAQMLSSFVSQGFTQVSDTVAFSEACINFFEAEIKREGADQELTNKLFLTTGNQLMQSMEYGGTNRSLRVGNVFTTTKSTKGYDLEMTKKRDLLYRRFCSKLAEIEPVSDEQYFQKLVRYDYYKKTVSQDLLPICQSIIMKDVQAGRALAWKYGYTRGRRLPTISSEKFVDLPPIRWLFDYALNNQRPDLIDDVVKAMEEKKESPNLAEIKVVRDLYFCKPEKFQTVAASAVANTKVTQPQTGTEVNFWQMVVEVSSARNLSDELVDFLAIAKVVMAKNSVPTAGNWYELGKTIAQKEGSESFELYLEDVAQLLMGDDRSPLQEANGRTYTAEESKKVAFIQLLNQMLNDHSTAFPTLMYMKDSTLAKSAVFSKRSSVFESRYSSSKSGEAFGRLLASSTLTAELDDFEVISYSNFSDSYSGSSQSMVGKLLVLLKSNSRSGSYLKALKAEVAKYPETFGVKLLQCVLGDKPDDKLLTLFIEHLGEIRTLPMSKQQDLSLLFADCVDLGRLSVGIDRDQRAAVRWFLANSATTVTPKLESYLLAKSIHELGIKPQSLVSDSSKIIKASIPFDLEKSFKAFENLSVIGESLVRTGEIKESSSSFSDNYLRYVLGGNLPLENFVFAIKAANSEKVQPFVKVGSYLRPLRDEINKTKGEDFTVIADFFSDVQGEIATAENDLRIAVPIFYQFATSIDSGARKRLLAWSTREDTRQQFPVLSENLSISINLASGGFRGKLSKQSIQQFADCLSSKKSNDLGVRLMIAESICRSSSVLVPDEILKLAIETVSECWEKEMKLSDYTIRTIVEKRRLVDETHLEEWKDIDLRLLGAFKKKYLAKSGGVTARPVKIDAQLLQTIILLQAQRKQFADSNQTIARYEAVVDSMLSDLFMTLVQGGSNQQASMLVRTKWFKILKKLKFSRRYDSAFEVVSKQFLASLKDEEPWVSFVGELFCIAPADSYRSSNSAQWVGREDRYASLAKRFRHDGFPTVEMRDLVMGELMNGAPEALSDQMNLVAKEWSPSYLAGIKSSADRSRKLHIYGSYLKNTLEEGSVQEAEVAYKAAGNLRESSAKKSIRYAIGRCIVEAMGCEGLSDDAYRGILHNALKVIADGAYRPNKATLGRLIFLHYLLGEEKLFVDRISSLPRSVQVVVFSEFEQKDFIRWIGFGTSAKQNSQISIRAYIDLLGYSGEFPSTEDNGSILLSLRDRLGKVKVADFQGPVALNGLMVEFILSAESVVECGVGNSGFKAQFVKYLSKTKSLAKQRELFDHGCQLIRQEQGTKDGWITGYWNGWSAPSAILKDFASASTEEGWRPLPLIADILWRDTPADFSYHYLDGFGEQSRFANTLKDESGLWRPNETIATICDRLASDLGDSSSWGATSVFLPIFYESCKAIGNPVHIVDYVKAADAHYSSSKNTIALQFSMAARFYLAKYHHEYMGHEKIPDQHGWHRHAVAAIKDAESCPQLRLALASHYLSLGKGLCSDELVRSATEALVETLPTDIFVNAYTFALVLEQFNQLVQDEWWQQMAPKLVAGFWHKSRFDSETTKKGRAYDGNVGVVSAVLETALLSKDKEAVVKVLKQKQGKLSESAMAMALLVRHKEFSLAEDMLKNCHLNCQLVAESLYFNVRYDRELHLAIPAFLETIKDKEQAFFASLLLNSLPDLGVEEDHWKDMRPELKQHLGAVDLPARAERMKVVAKSFAKQRFRSDISASRARGLLCSDWRVASEIEDILKAAFEKDLVNFVNIPRAAQKSAEFDPVLNHLICYAVYRVSVGDAEPFQKLVSGLSSTTLSKTSWGYEHSIERCILVLNRMLDECFLSMDQAQLAAAQQSYNTYFEVLGSSKIYDSFFGGLIRQIMVAAFFDDGVNDLKEWRQRHPRLELLETMIRVKAIAAPHTVASMLHLESHSPVAKLSEEQRVKIAKAILADPILQKAYSYTETTPMLLHLLQHHGLTPALIKKHDTELADLWPNRGLLELELTEFYSRRKDWQKAKYFAERSMSRYEATFSNDSRVVRHRLKLSLLLEEGGNQAILPSVRFPLERSRYNLGGKWFEVLEGMSEAIKLKNKTEAKLKTEQDNAPNSAMAKAPYLPPNAIGKRSSGDAAPANEGIVRISEDLKKLRRDLDQTTNKESINAIVDESKTMLSQIEELRRANSAAMSGPIGDAWWAAVKLKTDAVKKSRR